jgi:NADH-quinone oxidoreductase subunit C
MPETIDILKERFGSAVVETSDFRGDDTVLVKREFLAGMCFFLREDLGFDMLLDICGADYPKRSERFEVVYHLRSTEKGTRLRVKTRAPVDDAHVPSVHAIWKAANWFEREAFDMFGIRFEGHNNLKRLLTFDGFEGHPLRKDYPKNKRQRIPKPDPLVNE